MSKPEKRRQTQKPWNCSTGSEPVNLIVPALSGGDACLLIGAVISNIVYRLIYFQISLVGSKRKVPILNENF